MSDAPKIGRPPDYREGFADLVYKFRLLGLSVERIAELFEVDVSRLYKWKDTIPAFGEAWFNGGEVADAEIAHSLRKRAHGFEHEVEKSYVTRDGDVVTYRTKQYFPPDPASMKFYLTNRQRNWKDRQETQMTGKDGEALVAPAIVLTPVKPDEK